MSWTLVWTFGKYISCSIIGTQGTSGGPRFSLPNVVLRLFFCLAQYFQLGSANYLACKYYYILKFQSFVTEKVRKLFPWSLGGYFDSADFHYTNIRAKKMGTTKTLMEFEQSERTIALKDLGLDTSMVLDLMIELCRHSSQTLWWSNSSPNWALLSSVAKQSYCQQSWTLYVQ